MDIEKVLKRVFDFLFSTLLFLILTPFFLIMSLLIRLKIGSPVFFIQQRPGLNGKLIHVMKFRTMTDNVDSNGQLLPDSERMTGFGSWMRKYSVDELPQLLNVIKGDISFVGPRPLLQQYLSLYNHEQSRRHNVKPGITGWAQVNGRNAIDWDKKFELDVWYVDNFSLWLDFRILCLTLLKVVKANDVNHQSNVTMPEFKGNTVE